jgi:CheY-like chemotaxis protein
MLFEEAEMPEATILVVDDEPSLLTVLEKSFSPCGYQILTALSGEQALEIVEENAIDLVITDLKMDKMHGLELAEKLLKQDPDRPVLLMTGYGELENAQQALKVGVYEYFTKPLDMSDLMAGVKRALGFRQLQQEVLAYQRDLERKVVVRTRQLDKRIKELEARDTLLKQILFTHKSDEVLELSVKLSLSLCSCDIGFLYVESRESEFKRLVCVCENDGIHRVDFVGTKPTQETLEIFQQVLDRKEPVILVDMEDHYKQGGINSLAVVPISNGKEILALLKIGRIDAENAIKQNDVQDLLNFAPYIAMAVTELKITEELPRWRTDVNALLDEVERRQEI